MTSVLTRRGAAAAALGFALGGRLPPARAQARLTAQSPSLDVTSALVRDALRALETKSGGRLGVAAVDTGSGHWIGHRAEERFAMCSTHKFLTAAAILSLVDQGRLTLDQRVSYSRADLLEYAPVASKNLDAGFMTVDALCAATVGWSDNTANNLLLGLLGGPEGWTRYARQLGDATSQLDRIEPALNTAVPGDSRDTTTPDAMVRNLNIVLLDNALSDASRTRLESWMARNTVTASLLPAGLPAGWRVSDKSGAGQNGTRNDIGIIRPPKAAPILATIYCTESMLSPASRDGLIADAGRIIARVFGG